MIHVDRFKAVKILKDVSKVGMTIDARHILKFPEGYVELPKFVSAYKDSDSFFVYKDSNNPENNVECRINDTASALQQYHDFINLLQGKSLVFYTRYSKMPNIEEYRDIIYGVRIPKGVYIKQDQNTMSRVYVSRTSLTKTGRVSTIGLGPIVSRWGLEKVVNQAVEDIRDEFELFNSSNALPLGDVLKVYPTREDILATLGVKKLAD